MKMKMKMKMELELERKDNLEWMKMDKLWNENK